MKELFIQNSTFSGSLTGNRPCHIDVPKAPEAKTENAEQTLTPDQKIIRELLKPKESRPTEKLKEATQNKGKKEIMRFADELIIGKVPEQKQVVRFTEAEAGVIKGRIQKPMVAKANAEPLDSSKRRGGDVGTVQTIDMPSTSGVPKNFDLGERQPSGPSLASLERAFGGKQGAERVIQHTQAVAAGENINKPNERVAKADTKPKVDVTNLGVLGAMKKEGGLNIDLGPSLDEALKGATQSTNDTIASRKDE